MNKDINGVDLIAEERKRQIEIKGWSHGHDANHRTGDLSGAGAAYAMAASAMIMTGAMRAVITDPPPFFRFEREYWKPSDDPIRDLQKAGALIAAEIDRLIRARQETAERILSKRGDQA